MGNSHFLSVPRSGATTATGTASRPETRARVGGRPQLGHFPNPARPSWQRQDCCQQGFALFRAMLSVGLLFLIGCASEPTKPAVAPSQPPPPAATPAAVKPKDLLPPSAAKPPAPFEGDGWEALFDGKSLAGWRETPFTAPGEVECAQGALVLNLGDPFTGVNYTNPFPKMNYEIALDAMRVSGSDFFCGLTVPIGEDFCSLIVGGWGGGLVGISSLDGLNASENPTAKFLSFDQGRWYRIRLRVTQGRIEGWIDQDKVVDVVTTDRRISLRAGDIELSKPFGLSCWQTTAALREIKLRRVNTPADPAKRRYD